MTAPIEDAYAALAAAASAALAGCGLLPGADTMAIDPPSPFEPSGDETDVVTAAALLKLSTTPVQTFMGGASPRYVVERRVRFEICAAGPGADDDGEPAYKGKLIEAVAALAALPGSNPTLGGNAERFEFVSSEDGDLPPNGAKVLAEFTIRVRSGDPFGMTPT